jgi:hypothetical protein
MASVYPIEASGSLKAQGVERGWEPCGCHACDNGVQLGHFACEQPRAAELEAESLGHLVRVYEDGRWMWIVTAAGQEAADAKYNRPMRGR